MGDKHDPDNTDPAQSLEDVFPGSYRPNPEEIKRMLEQATISFDANALLHVYRYGEDAREQLLQALERIGDRLWIPYQAMYEFHKNREVVITDQQAAFQEISTAFDKLKKALDDLRRHHSAIDLGKVRSIGADAGVEAAQVLEDARPRLIDVGNDTLLPRLTAIIGTRFGRPHDLEVLKTWHDEAKERYSRSVPPGYEDEKKGEPEKYGDYVLWRELLDHAKATKRPIVLVTDEKKKDWLHILDGKTIGPRSELIAEMRNIAGVGFHLYAPDRFLEFAQKDLGVPSDPEVISEARDVGEEEGERRRLHDELLHLDWNVGSTEYGSEGVRILLRPWPDTWTTSETPETFWAQGNSHNDAIRNAIAEAKRRAT